MWCRDIFAIRFLGGGAVGDVYRFAADVVTVGILVGMVYFLVRRFVYRSPALGYRENVMLVEGVKAGGIGRDSLVVGLFILLHVGFRLLGESFGIALERLATGHGDAGAAVRERGEFVVGRDGRGGR